MSIEDGRLAASAVESVEQRSVLAGDDPPTAAWVSGPGHADCERRYRAVNDIFHGYRRRMGEAEKLSLLLH
jgi:hypothetical protein